MSSLSFVAILAGVLMAGTVARADDTTARTELTPTGKLRVAIAVGPAPSGIYVLKDAASGSIAALPSIYRRSSPRSSVLKSSTSPILAQAKSRAPRPQACGM